MKKLLLTIISILSFSCSINAADITFAWDYANMADVPTSFELRVSTTTNGPAVITKDCPGSSTRECTVVVPVRGKYFATVRAKLTDSLGTDYSGPSNEVSFTSKGTIGTPTLLIIKN
jgi:hypothetical protein